MYHVESKGKDRSERVAYMLLLILVKKKKKSLAFMTRKELAKCFTLISKFNPCSNPRR